MALLNLGLPCRLEVILEKKVEGVSWKNVVKSAEAVRSEPPLEEGLKDTLSADELEKAKKLLAELSGRDELVSLLYIVARKGIFLFMCTCRRAVPLRRRVQPSGPCWRSVTPQMKMLCCM